MKEKGGTRPAHRPSSREAILEASLELLTTDTPLSLAHAAQVAQISKSGLMYHFPTRDALLSALVEHIIDKYEIELREVLEGITGRKISEPDKEKEENRLKAYLLWSCHSKLTNADLIAFIDPQLREKLTALWEQRLGAWISISQNLPPAERAYLLSMRAAADGIWFDGASGTNSLTAADKEAIISHFEREEKLV